MMDAMTYSRFQQVFAEIMGRARGRYTAAELDEVEEFISAGEFGLALQTFAAIALEEGRVLERDLVDCIFQLAEEMEISDEYEFESLRKLTLGKV